MPPKRYSVLRNRHNKTPHIPLGIHLGRPSRWLLAPPQAESDVVDLCATHPNVAHVGEDEFDFEVVDQRFAREPD